VSTALFTQTAQTKETTTMTMSCRDAFDEGYQYGFSAADYCDFDDDEYVGDKGKADPETIGEFWEEFSSAAGESEANARDYSPWEFTAQAINEATEESEYDLWQCYEDGVYAGIKAGFVKRYKLTDAKQDKSVQKFGKELESEAKASRAEQPDDGGNAEGNPRKMTKAQFESFFREEILPLVAEQYEQDGIPDRPARREAWNDTVDAYIRYGDLPERAGDWDHPKWLETARVRLSSRGRNPYLGDAVKLAKQRKYGYPTPPTSRGATMPTKASSNPAKRRLMR